MTYPEDYDRRPQYGQQGYGQQFPQVEPQQQDDPFARQQRIGTEQQGTASQLYPQQAQSWEPPQHSQQPYGQPWPPQDQQFPPQAPPWQQQAYMPPQPRPKRKSWPARHKVLTGLIAFGAIVVIGTVASASNKPSTPTANAAAASSSASPSAAPSSASAAAQPDCATQAKNWVANGQLTTFGSDVGSFGTAIQALASDMQGTGATASDTATVQSAAATIESDAQAVEANPAPSCIPGLRGNITAAAKDYSTSAIDMTNALNQISAGDMAVATDEVGSANTAMGKGNAKISAATTDVTNYSDSQGG
jgi:hypothetical protein